MWEAKLTDISYNEVLLYLGYRGQDRSEELEAQIRRCMQKVLDTAVPRLCFRRFETSDPDLAEKVLVGKDIRTLLESSEEVVVFAATLGPETERLLMQTQVRNMADALIMDAAASAAVENVCNHFQEELSAQEAEQGYYLTDRFSPGYGDMPLSVQKDLCRILNTQGRIGLTVTPTDIMVPRKSVTALIGISDRPQPHRKSGCESCAMFLNCKYRKEGKNCS